MLRLKTILDTSGFKRAIVGIAAATNGMPIRGVIRAETGSILKACAGNTKVGTQANADLTSRTRMIRMLGYSKHARAPGDVTINTGVRSLAGRIWQRTNRSKWKMAGVINDRGNVKWEHKHFSNPQWNEILDAVQDYQADIGRWIRAGRAAIGLARQSWVQIGDDIGIPLESVPGGRISAAGIAKARRAIASDGKPYVNGSAKEYVDNRAFFIELVNRLPYGRKIHLDAILVKNVNARVRYFQTNVSKGVFNHLKQVARAYPGLRIDLN